MFSDAEIHSVLKTVNNDVNAAAVILQDLTLHVPDVLASAPRYPPVTDPKKVAVRHTAQKIRNPRYSETTGREVKKNRLLAQLNKMEAVEDNVQARMEALRASDGSIDTDKLIAEAERMGVIPAGMGVIPAGEAATFAAIERRWQWFGIQPPPPDVVLGELLGEGTFGDVYLGTEAVTGKQYAVKVFNKITLLYDEGVVLKWLNSSEGRETTSPHVVGYVGAWPEWVNPSIPGKTFPVLMTEFVDGSTLEELPSTPWFEITWITEQLFDGLQFLHNKGVVHRDLEARNVMLADPYIGDDGILRRGRVVIIDFGASHITHGLAERRTLFAPEEDLAIAQSYGVHEMLVPDPETMFKNDVWSAGLVVLSLMIPVMPPYGVMPDQVMDEPELVDTLSQFSRRQDVTLEDARRSIIENISTRVQAVEERQEVDIVRWDYLVRFLSSLVERVFVMSNERMTAPEIHSYIKERNAEAARATPPMVWRDSGARDLIAG
jgi:serine/threonine protein kinase